MYTKYYSINILKYFKTNVYVFLFFFKIKFSHTLKTVRMIYYWYLLGIFLISFFIYFKVSTCKTIFIGVFSLLNKRERERERGREWEEERARDVRYTGNGLETARLLL